jgi:hypothetical protein
VERLLQRQHLNAHPIRGDVSDGAHALCGGAGAD